jgi:uncharacterized protein YndB with AHSA1/START domain
MNEVATIAPVRKTLTVNCGPERAFQVFVGEVSSWWPTKTHSIHHDGVRDVVLEPREGGEMYEIAESGEREHWARVTAWEPPKRLVLAWQVNPETAAPTEIEVTFTPEGEGTRVELEHRGWEQFGDEAGEARSSYEGGWNLVLGRYGGAVPEGD